MEDRFLLNITKCLFGLIILEFLMIQLIYTRLDEQENRIEKLEFLQEKCDEDY